MASEASLEIAPSSSKYRIQAPTYQARVLFLGANGSGKTEVAAQMIRGYPRVVILDVKYDFPIPWPKGEYTILKKPPGLGWWFLDPWRTAKHIIYRPEPPYDTGPWITYFMDKMFARGRREGKRKPFILYLDEGGWAAYSGAKLAMARLAITGRSIGIGLWISAQRPRGIPPEVRSEAWFYYVFFLRKRADRKELLEVLDDNFEEEDFSATERDYEFWEIKRVKGGRLEGRRLPPVDIGRKAK